MLQFNLTSGSETIRNYRRRMEEFEQLGEYAIAEHIRETLIEERDLLIALLCYRVRHRSAKATQKRQRNLLPHTEHVNAAAEIGERPNMLGVISQLAPTKCSLLATSAPKWWE